MIVIRLLKIDNAFSTNFQGDFPSDKNTEIILETKIVRVNEKSKSPELQSSTSKSPEWWTNSSPCFGWPQKRVASITTTFFLQPSLLSYGKTTHFPIYFKVPYRVPPYVLPVPNYSGSKKLSWKLVRWYYRENKPNIFSSKCILERGSWIFKHWERLACEFAPNTTFLTHCQTN